MNLRTPGATKIVGALVARSWSPRSAGCSWSAPRPSSLAEARAEIQRTRDQNHVLATQLHPLEAQRRSSAPTRNVRPSLAGEVPAHGRPAGAVRGGHRGRRRRRHRRRRASRRSRRRRRRTAARGAERRRRAAGGGAGHRRQPGQPDRHGLGHRQLRPDPAAAREPRAHAARVPHQRRHPRAAATRATRPRSPGRCS